MRTDETRTRWPAGDTQSARRRSTPARKSNIRSWSSSLPERTSKGSSSTCRRMILPLVTLTAVWPASG
jgi:hypothetical protein